MPARASAAVVEAHVGERLAQVVVGSCRRRRCRARRRASKRSIAVDAVLARVRERGLGARAEQRALHLERRRAPAALPLGVCSNGRPSHSTSGRTGTRGRAPTLRRAGGVGDVGHDLQRGPEPDAREQARARAPEVEHLLDVPGKKIGQVQARRAATRSRSAGWTTCTLGSSPTSAIRRRRCARRPTKFAWRMASAARSSRAPCRTRCRSTPS